MMNMVYAIREKGTSFFLMVVLALSLAWVPDGVFAQNVDVSEIAALGLPVVVIETAGHEEPKYEFVPAPPGCNGDAIVNATKVPGEGYIVMGDSILWQSGKYLGGVSGLTIRIRGNSSAYADKKPYKLKLQREADLVDGNPQYADKEWLLIKNDTISFNTQIGLKVSSLVGMPWTPRSRLVNVIINGDYRGLYTLTENVKRNTRARIDVSKDGGYIFEWDAYWWNEPFYISDSRDCNFTFKYPKCENLRNEEAEYLRTFLDSIENAIDNGTYAEYIDVASFVNYLLAHDILGTYDGAGSNTFLTKYDDSPASPVRMLTLWDFDTIMRQYGGWGGIHYAGEFWYPRLLDNPNPDFVRAYISRWEEIRNVLPAQMEEWLDEYNASDEFKAAERSWTRDLERYGNAFPSAQQQIDRARSWFSSRTAYIDAAIVPYIKLSIATFSAHSTPLLFDLQGRRLTAEPRHGVFIKDGRKVMK